MVPIFSCHWTPLSVRTTNKKKQKHMFIKIKPKIMLLAISEKKLSNGALKSNEKYIS